MHARPARIAWTNSADPWTSSVRASGELPLRQLGAAAESLAIRKRRLPVLALERAREVQLVLQADAEGDLADLHIGEAQQPRGLEHHTIHDQRLRRAARGLRQRTREHGRR